MLPIGYTASVQSAHNPSSWAATGSHSVLDCQHRAMSSKCTPQPHIATNSCSRDSPRPLAQQMPTHDSSRLLKVLLYCSKYAYKSRQATISNHPRHAPIPPHTSAQPFCSHRLICCITHSSHDRSVLRHSTTQHSTTQHDRAARRATARTTAHIRKVGAPLTPTREEGGSQAVPMPQ